MAEPLKTPAQILASNRILDYSYCVTIDVAEELKFQDAEISQLTPRLRLYTNRSAPPRSWTHFESSTHQFWLDGYFYLKHSNSVSPNKNLETLAGLTTNKALEVGLAAIAGGLFNLCVQEKVSGTVTFVNDRLGMLALYHRQLESGCILTNNQFNLLGLDLVDQTSIIEFLKFGYLPVSESLIQGVKRLPANSILKTENAGSPPIVHPSELPVNPNPDLNNTEDEFLAIKWTTGLLNYFKRIKSRKIMQLLGGDYSSRLLAAHIPHLDPRTINYGGHFQLGTKTARDVSKALKLLVYYDKYLDDVVAEYAGDAPIQFRCPVSLEFAPVLQAMDALRREGASQFISGVLGDVLMGDRYQPVARSFDYLKHDSDSNRDHRTVFDYQQEMLELGFHTVSDTVLTNLLGAKHTKSIHSRFKALVELIRAQTHGPADFAERFKILTHGRQLQGALVNAAHVYADVIAPFLDYDLLELGMHSSPVQRKGLEVMNQVFRDKFPEMVHIPPEGTRGKPDDSAFMFRLKTVLFHWFAGKQERESSILGAGRLPELDRISPNLHLAHERTEELIENTMRSSSRFMPFHIHTAIRNEHEEGRINPLLLVRYISLIIYFNSQQESN